MGLEKLKTTKLKPSPWIWWTLILTQRNSFEVSRPSKWTSHKVRCKEPRHQALQWVWLCAYPFPSAKVSAEFFRVLVSRLRGPRLVSQTPGLGRCLLPVGPWALASASSKIAWQLAFIRQVRCSLLLTDNHNFARTNEVACEKYKILVKCTWLTLGWGLSGMGQRPGKTKTLPLS